MLKIRKQWRRWSAIFSLIITICLLISGLTFLEPKLSGKTFIIFWLICFFFTVLSILLALVELRFINYQSRKEQKDLIEKTVDELNEIFYLNKDKKKNKLSPNQLKDEKNDNI